MRWEALATHRLFQKLRLATPLILSSISSTYSCGTRINRLSYERASCFASVRERERESHVTLSPHLTLIEVDCLPWQLSCFQSPQGLEWPTWNTHTHEECKYIAIYIYIYLTWPPVVVFVRFYCLCFLLLFFAFFGTIFSFPLLFI